MRKESDLNRTQEQPQKFPHEGFLGRFFYVPAGCVNLVGEGASRLSNEDVVGMLEKVSNGDWGNVSEMFKKGNDEAQDRKTSTYSFWGEHQVGSTEYEIYVSMRDGEAERVSILSKEDGEKLSKDLMGATFSQGMKEGE